MVTDRQAYGHYNIAKILIKTDKLKEEPRLYHCNLQPSAYILVEWYKNI